MAPCARGRGGPKSILRGAGVRISHMARLPSLNALLAFEGPKNRLALTPAGATLLRDLTAGFDRIEAGVRRLREDANSVLDVSCLGTFAMRWLIPRLHRFQATWPGIEVRLSASD